VLGRTYVDGGYLDWSYITAVEATAKPVAALPNTFGGGVFRALRRIAAIRYDDNNASMSARVRQVAWVAAALVVPVALSAALLPLRYHVDDVLVAVMLLAVSSAALARAE
jgi:hypothetical protein